MAPWPSITAGRPTPRTAGRAIGAAVDERLAADGLALERSDGRMIVELRPAGAGGKGAAVGRLLAELEPASVLAMGDDRSDVEGFRLLASERGSGRLTALNVGIHDRTATPPALVEAADVMLDAAARCRAPAQCAGLRPGARLGSAGEAVGGVRVLPDSNEDHRVTGSAPCNVRARGSGTWRQEADRESERQVSGRGCSRP